MSSTDETTPVDTPLPDNAALSRLVSAGAGAACFLILVGIWLLLVPDETESALAVFAAAVALAFVAVIALEEQSLVGSPAQARDLAFHARTLTSLLIRNEETVLVAAITLGAAILRLWALDDIPNGIHGDEAQWGTEAWRVLQDGWIGVYTLAVLGQPAGHAYLTAPFLEILGSSTFSLRLPVALVGTAAVPLAYAVFRLQANRTVATIAALMLATSLWHIHYSRIAHWTISYATVELLVLLFWTLAMRDGRWRWFFLAGATLGLGVYTYNVYPIFVIAFAIWVALYTLVSRRGREFGPWATKVAGAAVVSFIVAMPMLLYILDDSNDYMQHYNQYYEAYSVLATDAYEQGNMAERIDIVANQLERWIGAYAWQGVPDFVDGAAANGEPMFDKLTVALLVIGAGYAAWNWRKTPNLMTLVLVLVIPLTSVLQTNSTYRGALGVVPFVAFLAALPLAWFWQRPDSSHRALRLVMRLGVGAILVVIAYISLHAYFGQWADSDAFRFVYAEEISEASEYMAVAPGNPYVYFLSDRWSFNYETRQYLAPRVQGEDRASRFSQRQDLDIDRTRDSLFVLLAPHLDKLDQIRSLYPGGSEHSKRDEGRILFIAYHVSADASPESPGEQPIVRAPTTEVRARDEERRQDLALMADALGTIFRDKGQYPSTNGNVQSACRYTSLDQLCFLEPQVGEAAFLDPRGDQERYGYWYKSDGATFTLFASMEGQVEISETCPPERHLQASDVRNLLCVRSP